MDKFVVRERPGPGTRSKSLAKRKAPAPEPAPQEQTIQQWAAEVFASSDEEDTAEAGPAEPETKKTRGASSRVNWSKGANAEKLKLAVDAWDQKQPPFESGMSMSVFAKAVGIPRNTLFKYARHPIEKRLLLGSHVGRKRLISEQDEQVIVDVAKRADRANEGKSAADLADDLLEMNPHLSKKQVVNAMTRTIRPQRKDDLTGIIKAQSTTTRRSAISIEQQWRWHREVNAALEDQLRWNSGGG